MFSDIGCGWATLKLGDFKGSCSYLTDPFVDVANLLINKEGVVAFDEEGSVFELVISNWSIYIVSHRDKDELHMLDITEEELAAEFLDDIRNNFEDIINWDINDGYEDSEYLVERRKMFNNFISKIKEIYNIEKSPEDISYWVYEVDMSKEDYEKLNEMAKEADLPFDMFINKTLTDFLDKIETNKEEYKEKFKDLEDPGEERISIKNAYPVHFGETEETAKKNSSEER